MSASGLSWTVSPCPGEYELALSIYLTWMQYYNDVTEDAAHTTRVEMVKNKLDIVNIYGLNNDIILCKLKKNYN